VLPLLGGEFSVPDYNKYAHLAAADPVGDLRQATGGKLSRSTKAAIVVEPAEASEVAPIVVDETGTHHTMMGMITPF
jgi:hypothetical protein